MITYDWPDALRAQSDEWHLDYRNRSGGETITGREQVIYSGLGRWVATRSIVLFDRKGILAYRALMARLKGRANAVVVGPSIGPTAPRVQPLLFGLPYPGPNLLLPAGIKARSLGREPTLMNAAPAGANAVEIDPGTTVGLEPGVLIGFGQRLYVIEDIDGTNYQISPKLRDAVPTYSPVIWDKPRCLMRLQADDGGSADIQLDRTGSVSLSFVEVW